MRVEKRSGLMMCGLLDFQDAVLGPQSYDLVSLLEDSRRDVSPVLAQRMRQRYLAGFPAIDRAAFDISYTVLGAQRHAKVIGIFTRLCVRDGKPRYLAHIPRLWRMLERNFEHPVLAPVAAWFDAHIPASLRRIPSLPAAS
jgi:aminoglycoside/choline kinase family phosphotransferase